MVIWVVAVLAKELPLGGKEELFAFHVRVPFKEVIALSVLVNYYYDGMVWVV